jgi:hypothetical protein
LSLADMACSSSLLPIASFPRWQGRSTAGPSHYQTKLPSVNKHVMNARSALDRQARTLSEVAVATSSVKSV